MHFIRCLFNNIHNVFYFCIFLIFRISYINHTDFFKIYHNIPSLKIIVYDFREKKSFFLFLKMYCIIMYIMYAHFQKTIVVLFIKS